MSKITTITQKEYDEIQANGTAAQEILTDERFQFLRDYFTSAQEYAKNSIVENTILEVREIVTISEKLTKMFVTPKKVQVDELSGQYKLIKKFFADLQQFVDIKNELDKAVQDKKAKVDG